MAASCMSTMQKSVDKVSDKTGDLFLGNEFFQCDLDQSFTQCHCLTTTMTVRLVLQMAKFTWQILKRFLYEILYKTFATSLCERKFGPWTKS